MAKPGEVKASDLALLAEAAKAAGLSPGQVDKLTEKYEERAEARAERAAQIRFCGNVAKDRLPDGRRPVCGREPHPDEPGSRTAHALRLEDDTLVTWFSPLTLGEQAENERAGGKPACGAQSEPLGGHVMSCRRGVHGADAPHLGQHPEHGLTSW